MAALFVTFIVLVAITPSGIPIVVPITTQQLWVANHPTTQASGSAIARISITRSRLMPTITTGSLATGLGVTPDESDILVTNRGAGTLSVIDTASGRVVHSISVGSTPDAVAAGYGQHQVPLAVVANVLTSEVTIVNLQTFRVMAKVHVGVWPSAVYVVPEGSQGAGLALVTDYGSSQLSTIDLGTLKVRSTIGVGKFPNAIAVVPGGYHNEGVAAVTDAGSDELTPVEIGQSAALPPIQLTASPTDVGANGGSTIWITLGESLLPINLIRRTEGPAIPLPRSTQSIVLDTVGFGAWVGEQGGLVQLVDLQSGAVQQTYVVGGLPQSMIITSPRTGNSTPPSPSQNQ
jgi:YVTN family beta-propeller protein